MLNLWRQSNKFPGLLSEYIKELDDTNVDFVSCDAYYFDIVKYYFPNVAHLFWVTDGPNNQKNKTDHIFETDKNTYVILNQNWDNTIYWFVDGNFAGNSNKNETLFITGLSGTHNIVVTDDKQIYLFFI